jgi:endonuclease/exonuclease/phosphatase (EEP) superfamily protein YafD
MSTSPGLGLPKRLVIAGINLLTPLHAGLIIAYFMLRWLGGGRLWFIDALGYILPWLFTPLTVLLPAALLRRSRRLLVVAAVPAVLFLLTYGHLYLPRLPVCASGPTFTVMTYNILGRNRDTNGVAASVEVHAPDFFGLHELEPRMAKALEVRFAERYPYHEVGRGCGIFSRYPVLQCETVYPGLGSGFDAQQCVLDIEGYHVTVLNVHPRSPPLRGFRLFGLPLGIPTGLANEGRDADVRALLARIEETEDPLIVIGDLNLTDQQSLYQPLTYHLRDAHREGGWGMGFTFARFPRLGLAMWRIDYVLHSPDLVTLSTQVGDFGGSDHRPVIAELAFRMPK